MRLLDAPGAALQFLAIALLIVSLLKLVFVPLAVWFEVRLWATPRGLLEHRGAPVRGRLHRRRDHKLPPRRNQGLPYSRGTLVSIIVPAYNEGVVLANCIESIVRSRYRFIEIIIVDDGSTDDTRDVMNALAQRHPQTVRAIHQANAGKGAALNRGIAEANGEVLLFVDADGLFTAHTIEWLLLSLSEPGVGAVCGDDRPANPDRPLTQLLSVMSHVGTGLVRRALSVLRCLPIVSGNIGAFRASVISEIGGFREDTIGEDLELTWRIYESGHRVVFQPRAIVYAESPSTLHGLWRQRVRWARGLLQTTRIHRRSIGNPDQGVFGIFLALNTFAMVIAPPLQLLVLITLMATFATSLPQTRPDLVAFLGWLGILLSAALVVFAIAMNRAWHDLRYLWTLPLWPVYSVGMSFTMISAIVSEVRGSPARWNKLQRTGVITEGVVAGMARLEHG